MKIYIAFNTVQGPAGGGNQFLKALKNEYQKRNGYTSNPEEADIILFNSHHNLLNVIKLRMKYLNKIFVHRIDGPMRVYNGLYDIRDKYVYLANRYIADGTVFQSNYSKEANKKQGLTDKDEESVIMNAPDQRFFNTTSRKDDLTGRKVKIIASSWSENLNKGFEVYKWLDNKLDFDKFDMTFIGRSPIRFKNISMREVMAPENLADEIKQHDIYITASQKEACSNSLLEALHCGLPSLVLRDGSNPELVGKGGECFDTVEEIPLILDKMVESYLKYKNSISVPNIEEVADKYKKFFLRLKDREKNFNRKTLFTRFIKGIWFIINYYLFKIKTKFKLK